MPVAVHGVPRRGTPDPIVVCDLPDWYSEDDRF